jgi:hypothetical protein
MSTTYIWASIAITTSTALAYKYIQSYFQNYFYPKTRTDLIHIRSNLYELIYSFKGKQYRIYMNIHKGPKEIISVTTKHGDVITDDVLSLMGPNQDFHSNLFVPDFSECQFHTIGGAIKTFQEVLQKRSM